MIICDAFLCPLYNLITVRDISMKLHTLVKHIQTTFYAQEPELGFGYFWSYFHLIFCDAIFCRLYNLIIVRDISTKLHTLVKHIQTKFYAQEPELSFEYFWRFFPLIICDSILCPLYNLISIRSISTKLHTFVKHIQTMCRVQEPELCFGYFWSYYPLIICNAFLCLLYNLITVKDILKKLHTFVKHIQIMCHA